MKSSHTQLNLIQVLRGIAAIIVVIHHSTGQIFVSTGYTYLNNFFIVGWFGVDLFFVLSGFIIFFIHYYDLGKKEKLKNYILKRISRIYPAYWIITLLLIPLVFLIPSLGQDYMKDYLYIFKSLLLIPQTNSTLLIVGWTLIHEIFFYFMFSLFIYFNRYVSSIIMSFWFFGTILGVLNYVHYNHYLLKIIFSNYNIEFFLGSIIALIFIKRKLRFKTALFVLIVGILSLLLSWWGAYNDLFIKGDSSSVLVFGLSGALIIFGLVNLEYRKTIKVPKPFLFLGDASYSIYLTHFYVIIFLEKIISHFTHVNPFNNFVTTTIIITIASICGCIFYQIIEKPLLKNIKVILFSKKEINDKRNIS